MAPGAGPAKIESPTTVIEMLPNENTPGQTMKVFNHGFRDINHPITVRDPAITIFPVFPCSTVPRSVKSTQGPKAPAGKARLIGCDKRRLLRVTIAPRVMVWLADACLPYNSL